MGNEILIFSLDGKFNKFERGVKTIGEKVLKILKKNNVSVDIYLTGSAKMKFLNKKFRLDKTRIGADGNADKRGHASVNQLLRINNSRHSAPSILSFEEPKNFILPPSKSKKIGEIYLNAELCGSERGTKRGGKRKSALSQSRPALLIHGLLHLLGYKHGSKNDRIKMERAEQRTLHKIQSAKHAIRNNNKIKNLNV